MIGYIVFIISQDQYNQPVVLIAIDSYEKAMLLSDDEYPLGIVEVKTIQDEKAEPEGLLVIKYTTMTGTGMISESIRVYDVSNSRVIPSLNIP